MKPKKENGEPNVPSLKVKTAVLCYITIYFFIYLLLLGKGKIKKLSDLSFEKC